MPKFNVFAVRVDSVFGSLFMVLICSSLPRNNLGMGIHRILIGLWSTRLRWFLFPFVCFFVPIAQGQIELREVSESAGVSFTHQSGAIGKRWTLEITGAGIGLLDFDNDNLLDIWAIQGGPLKDRGDNPPLDRVYRNVSTEDELRFEDVTETIGIHADGYGMGLVTGDIDNDGDVDVVVLNFKHNQLFRNDGGTFTEVVDSVLTESSEWSLSGSFADLNSDGWLDLYVANYMEFPPIEKYRVCRRMSTRKGYCAPSNFEPTPDRLYFNNKDGTFTDVSEAAGIRSLQQRGMGVVIDDFNGDAKPDIYVANDMAMNFLWLQQEDGNFKDDALYSGVAVNGHGLREASMGVASADWDRDFDPDIFLTHDIKESNTLYVYEHVGWFSDQTVPTGLGAASLPKTGFGTVFLDVENDGDLDLFVANGSVSMIDAQLAAKIEPPLRQSNQLFVNHGEGRFEILEGTSLSRFEEVSRGAAKGDLDNDGDVDIVVSNNDGPLRIHENLANGDLETSNNWIGVHLKTNNRDAIGAVVFLDGEIPERELVRTGGSYASASDPRLIFGLGADDKARTVIVHWSDGTSDSFENLLPNRYHQIRQPDL